MILKISQTFAVVAIIVLPAVTFAQLGIPCGDLTVPGGHECGFNDLLELANNIIKFLMIDVAVPLAALGFMYMGAKMVLLPNKESSVTEAKEGAMFIVKGFAIMLGAYVLIKSIIFALVTDDQASLIKFLFQ